jgi:2'-5' RNA ligase
LRELQASVQAVIPADPAIEWLAVETYHITLLYTPTAELDAVLRFKALLTDYPPPELTLRVGSLGTFDKVGRHALHFLIRRNPALLEYQATLYDLAMQSGITLSSTSRPELYKPHITVAYVPDHLQKITYTGTTLITPDFATATFADVEIWSSVEPEPPPLDPDGMTNELKAFGRYIRKHGAIKAAKFRFEAIPPALGDALHYRLSADAGTVHDALKVALNAIEGSVSEDTAAYLACLTEAKTPDDLARL